MPLRRVRRSILKFLQLESSSSIFLLIAAILALVIKNYSPTSAQLYDQFLNWSLSIGISQFTLDKPLLLWINDGLMAIFFLLVGLELKREILEGQLSDWSQVALPIIAAIGGMVMPALVYLIFNWGNSATIPGWAIPSATDIAFSLGVLALLGNRVPLSLKLFLMALAIIDDLGAIIIIALFYSGHHLQIMPLYFAGGTLVILWLLNISDIKNLLFYIITGLVLWVCVLKSGIHATLAGVALAAFIPLRTNKMSTYQESDNETESDDHLHHSPLRRLEHRLHSWVAFLIMPLFAFANAGVSFEGITLNILWEPVPLGIVLGLFIGKQLGVLGFSWITITFGFAQLPEKATWWSLYGVSILCGIGFTMSLFIGSLAFTEADYMNQVRLGVLLGSLISALAGYFILLLFTNNNPSTPS